MLSAHKYIDYIYSYSNSVYTMYITKSYTITCPHVILHCCSNKMYLAPLTFLLIYNKKGPKMEFNIKS